MFDVLDLVALSLSVLDKKVRSLPPLSSISCLRSSIVQSFTLRHLQGDPMAEFHNMPIGKVISKQFGSCYCFLSSLVSCISFPFFVFSFSVC
jgi:hypothetical protein